MAEAETKSGIKYNPPTVRPWRDEGHFVIPEVSYRGETGDYALFEEMTPAMTQHKLIELYEREKQAGNPVPTDAPLIWAIATRGDELRDENPEEAQRLSQFFRNSLRRYPNTLTRVDYSPEGDCILHNVGTSDQYSTEGKVFGPNEWVHKVPDKDVLERLLGTQDAEQINKISQQINGTDFYLWRFNSKPKQLDKRVARFGARDGRLYLDCDRGPLGEGPAFRVLQLE